MLENTRKVEGIGQQVMFEVERGGRTARGKALS